MFWWVEGGGERRSSNNALSALFKKITMKCKTQGSQIGRDSVIYRTSCCAHFFSFRHSRKKFTYCVTLEYIFSLILFDDRYMHIDR